MKGFLIASVLIIQLFAFIKETDGQVLDSKPRDGVYDKTTILQVQPIPYPYLREADVIWTKRVWRNVDLREKMNQPFYYPDIPQSNWKSFATILWDGIKEGTIVAYNPDIDDQFTSPMTFQEVQARVESTDTAWVDDPDNEEGPKIRQIRRSEFDPTEVKNFKIKEDYYFDRQRSVFEVRILGVCIETPYKVKGIQFGNRPLFWVYFPDCRNLFAQNEIFNLKNGAAGRMTYDDVFMKRMFSSYIYKEENVYNRTIANYANGVDALLESERVKNALQEFEANLWEY